ncbi:MAG: hypothetical protein HOP28_17090 [Gemmatimonadales bacterium]|nr:hypothetical protein [Gemmatimonadales bacterium]
MRPTPAPLPSRLVALVAPLLLAACGSSDPGPDPSILAGFEVVSGSNQTAAAGSVVGQPIVFRALNAAGGPVAAAAVTPVLTGGGSVSPTVAVTGENGLATFIWTLGPTVGQQTLTTSLTTGVGAVSVTATATSPAVAGTIPPSP